MPRKATTPEYFCLTCQKEKTPDHFYPYAKRRCKKCLIKKQISKQRVKDLDTKYQKKMRILLYMVAYMMKGRRTISELSRRFELHGRTVYRYLNLMEGMEFGLEQDFNGKFFIVDGGDCPLCGRKHKTEESANINGAAGVGFKSRAVES